jgi:hypothetical protein
MTTAAASVPVMRTTDGFYVMVAVVALAVATAAFAPSLIDGTARRGPITAAVTSHAVFASAWLVVYFVQTLLVARRRVRLHRRMGVAAAPVAVGLVVSGYIATIQMARRGFELSGDLSALPGGAMAQTVFQFGNLLVFSLMVALALALRRRPETHKRLMAIAVIQTLMAAPVAHLVGHYALPPVLLPLWGILVFGAFVAHDRRAQGRVHAATIWGCGGLVVLANTEAFLIGPSQAWQRMVAWLIA